jgi:phosphate transport system substrate-binding protein
VSVIGSTSVQPFAEMLAAEFCEKHPDIPVEVQGGGSTAGVQAVLNGIADIGMCSRSLNEKESHLQAQVIARDGLAIVVHPTNPLAGLSRDQLRRIFAGALGRWSDVGGAEKPIRLITREEGSGTREAFTRLVMGKTRIFRRALTQESNGAVKELVRHDPCAIGYMSLGLVGDELKALAVDGVAPSAAAVMDKTYPLVRPFLFITNGEPGERAGRFIAFVLSPEGQELLKKEGLVAAR